MKIRPFHVYGLLLAVVGIPAWRLGQLPRAEVGASRDRIIRWASLAEHTPEELENGVASRYRRMAAELKGVRDVGYLCERNKADLWAASRTTAGHDGIERYYMAQFVLAPTLLRLDELRNLIVIDCATPEDATRVLNREGLVTVRDFGEGLVLARPES